ncbi:serine/threonine-protein kinase [Nocardia sp. NPDC020380]|uniref:serine/threonine-protein kinase n=1 Tax=Nocardia sp. NPDC020380 TaxID=3364309 RepID=UPI00378AE6E9
MDFTEGTVFAGYRIERTLGSGGMGAVYLAQHPRLPRKDALKVLSAERSAGAEFRARFLREAEVAARLRHPNLVAVRDRGEQDGRLWIAMQYVAGIDLSQLIVRSEIGLDPFRAVHILTEVAQGLDEIHRSGHLHRDVKPGNILIAEEPDRPDQVLVSDFGIARPADDSTTLAADGGFTGTLAYAAPEQFEEGRFDHRIDVYALGCTLFHMLTASVPFPRTSTGAVIYAHMHEAPPRPSQSNPLVPVGFDAVVAKAMAKAPGERYRSCGELAAAARAALTAPGIPRYSRDVPEPRPVRIGRRTRILLAGAVIALVAVVAAAAVMYGLRPAASTAAQVVYVSPQTGTTEPGEWGVYGFIPQAFPDLLPPVPFGAGYQELTSCDPIGSDIELHGFSVSGPVAELECVGNSDPAYAVNLQCNTDRSRISPNLEIARPEGDEAWTRPSGTGHLFWGYGAESGTGTTLDGRSRGVLDLYFDDPKRNFCRIEVLGVSTTGAELRAGWWPNAPL